MVSVLAHQPATHRPRRVGLQVHELTALPPVPKCRQLVMTNEPFIGVRTVKGRTLTATLIEEAPSEAVMVSCRVRPAMFDGGRSWRLAFCSLAELQPAIRAVIVRSYGNQASDDTTGMGRAYIWGGRHNSVDVRRSLTLLDLVQVARGTKAAKSESNTTGFSLGHPSLLLSKFQYRIAFHRASIVSCLPRRYNAVSMPRQSL